MNQDPAAAETFRAVTEAYELLRDVDKRQRYDQFGPAAFAKGRPPAPDAAASARFYDEMFGGRPPRAATQTSTPPTPAEPEVDESSLSITLEDAYHSATKSVSLEQTVIAPDGGRRLEMRQLAVKIPPGVTAGMKIRLAGQGAPWPGKPPRDLLLEIQFAAHAQFVVDGYDVQCVLPVSPWEAALGAKVPVRTLDGEVIVTVPPGCSSGQRLRIKARGLPMRDGTRGAQRVEVRIVVPEHLSDLERSLFEQLARVSTFTPRKPV